MRKLTKKISMLMVLAMLVGLFSGVVSASAASAWSFKSGKYNVAVGGEINMKKNEYADFDLLKDGKAPEGYTVVWKSSDEDVVWVNAKTGQLRADKAKKAEDGDKAVISATFTNTKTKKSATRSFTIVVGEVKAPVYTVEQADVTAVLGDAIKFAPVVKNEAGEVVKFATHKSYNGYFVDGKAITNPWTPEVAGEYTVTVAQFASKADVADLTKLVRKDEFKVTVKADLAAEATGVKEITVYGDFAKDAKFTVKKGSVTIAVSDTKVAENGKSATLTLANKLTKGTYTVACGEDKAEFVAEDEYVDSIVILDDGKIVTLSPDRRQAYVHYDVFNQYNESVRQNHSIAWTASTNAGVGDTKSTGTLAIAVDTDPTKTWIYGTTIIITGVYQSGSNVETVNATVTAGLENRVDSVEILGVVKDGGSEIVTLPKGFKDKDYMLVYKAYDQDGYEMTYTDALVGDNLTFTSLDPLLVSADFVQLDGGVVIDGVRYGAVRISRGIQTNAGGLAEIQVTSKATGTTKIHNLEVGAEQILNTFALLAPDFIIAEEDGYVEIPFEAFDQNGVPVTSFRTLYASVSLNDSRLKIEKKNDGSAKVVFDVTGTFGASENADAPVVFTSTVINSGYVSTLNLSIKDTAVPVSVKGLGSWIKNNLAEGGNAKIALSCNDWEDGALKYYDQYDREMGNGKAKARLAANPNLRVAYKTTGTALGVWSGGAANPANVGGYTVVSGSELKITGLRNATETTLKQSIEFVVVDVTNLSTPKISIGRIIEFANHDITQFRSFKFNPYGGTDTLIKNGTTSTYKSVLGSLANGAEADIPEEYITLEGFDPTWTGSVAVTASSFSVSPNYAADMFLDKSVLKQDGKPTEITRTFDVVAKISVTGASLVAGATPYVKGEARETITVNDDDVHYTTIKPKFEGDTFTVRATDGEIYYRDIINAAVDKVLSNYGDVQDDWDDGKAANVNVTISKVVDAEDGLYAGDYADVYTAITPVIASYKSNEVRSQDTNSGGVANYAAELMLKYAETGDTFEVNFAFDYANVTFKCVVGADKNAFFNSCSDTVTWR